MLKKNTANIKTVQNTLAAATQTPETITATITGAGLITLAANAQAGTNGTVYLVDFENGNLEKYIENTGGIDGIEKVSQNQFIISDWSGKVQLISPDKKPVVLFDTTNEKINGIVTGIINCWVSASLSTADPIAAKRAAYKR